MIRNRFAMRDVEDSPAVVLDHVRAGIAPRVLLRHDERAGVEPAVTVRWSIGRFGLRSTSGRSLVLPTFARSTPVRTLDGVPLCNWTILRGPSRPTRHR